MKHEVVDGDYVNMWGGLNYYSVNDGVLILRASVLLVSAGSGGDAKSGLACYRYHAIHAQLPLAASRLKSLGRVVSTRD